MEYKPEHFKLSVLVVEDSEVILARIITLLCELSDITVIGKAMNSKEAIIINQTMKPDVVILDIGIPGKSGIHVLREIKQQSKETKVIMLTNYSDAYYRNICTEQGADFFFDKSTEFEKIPEALSSFFTTKINNLKVSI